MQDTFELNNFCPNGKCRLLLMNNPGEQDLKIHFKDQNMKTSTITSDHVRTTTFPSNTDIKRPLTIYHTVLEPDKIVFIIITGMENFFFHYLVFSFSFFFEAIFLLPISAFLLICCLRRRAKLARERDRQLNFGLQSHAVSLVRFSHFPGESGAYTLSKLI